MRGNFSTRAIRSRLLKTEMETGKPISYRRLRKKTALQA